ncbi:hypothetical protein [Kangiella sp.]|uniref:hypothetical protein n=1 Tax=Kangiella sp. TaxID=1920245 RepID=UPI0019A367EF|nr:hypothetical protein [Kangiella sp.]MBD3653129.1 hypothetical protein [Kangiella sp.]
MNHLEQLIAEWYEYRGYFVRRNIQVGPRVNGGYECELDVVAFNPVTQHLVHIEPSMDAHSWAKREQRYSKKFAAGRAYIPSLFGGLALPDEIEQIALLGFASNANVKSLAGGRVMTAAELFAEIVSGIGNKKVARSAIPEQFPLLRTIQFACEHRHSVGWN